MALSWLAAAFLIATGLLGATVGMLLWPAAALHLIFGGLALARLGGEPTFGGR